MNYRKFKNLLVPSLYAVAIIAVLGSVYLIETNTNEETFVNDDHYGKVYEYFDETVENVIAEEKVLIRPYNDAEIQILKTYYDYQADDKSQENSIIYHEDTYMQNSSVIYGGKENFDVIAVYDGKVIEVKEDPVLGNIVQIEHENNYISIYQSLSEVTVKKDDIVKQGDKLGLSGTSNLNKDLGSHLSFEIIKSGEIVNPELHYDKPLSQ